MIVIKYQKAFTMIELVIVIVLLGILSVSFANILSQSVFSYMDAKGRNEHSQTAKWVTEIISRSVREALPQSIRTGTSGSLDCLEYVEIVNAGSYFNLPATGPVSSFNIVSYDLVFQAGQSVAIMPINPASIYVGNNVVSPITSIAASGPQQSLITLTSPTNFAQRSPQNRMYILSTPITFCLNNNTGLISRYFDYGFVAALAFPPSSATSEIIGENFWANGNVFNYQSGTLQRSGLLQINFVIQDRVRFASGTAESFEVFHEVHVRNVP